jgi:hypothetical protein
MVHFTFTFYQNKFLPAPVNAPWYRTNKFIHAQLKIPTVRKEITKYNVKYKDKIATHPNKLTSTLL